MPLGPPRWKSPMMSGLVLRAFSFVGAWPRWLPALVLALFVCLRGLCGLVLPLSVCIHQVDASISFSTSSTIYYTHHNVTYTKMKGDEQEEGRDQGKQSIIMLPYRSLFHFNHPTYYTPHSSHNPHHMPSGPEPHPVNTPPRPRSTPGRPPTKANIFFRPLTACAAKAKPNLGLAQEKKFLTMR